MKRKRKSNEKEIREDGKENDKEKLPNKIKNIIIWNYGRSKAA
jgi:hypothetical protein